MTIKEKFKKIQEVLLKETRMFYGDRLVSVVIFGSVARGTYREDSDLDVLIIAERLPLGRMKRVEEFSLIEEKLEPLIESMSKEGLHTCISAIFKTPEEAKQGSPLFLDLIEDAVILFDRDQFFAGILERLRKRLQELGARRVWRGDWWYWDLKPDYKPGEIFEL